MNFLKTRFESLQQPRLFKRQKSEISSVSTEPDDMESSPSGSPFDEDFMMADPSDSPTTLDFDVFLNDQLDSPLSTCSVEAAAEWLLGQPSHSPHQPASVAQQLGQKVQSPPKPATVPPAQPPKSSVPPRVSDSRFAAWNVGTRYTLQRLIGQGSYGEVAEAIDNVTGRRVAIKHVADIFDHEVDARRTYRELYILRQLKHSNVVNLLDVIPPTSFDKFNDLYLVFECVDTDLYKLLLSPQYLTNQHIQAFLYQMLTGLKYIHSTNVAHRDIKPANLLLNEDCSLKICDFGLSRVMAPAEPQHQEAQDDVEMPPVPVLSRRQMSECAALEEDVLLRGGNDERRMENRALCRQLTKHVVTRWYRAPELILLQDYTNAVDVWAVGCIFAELLNMQAESVPEYWRRSPLFPGRSCYPLSVDKPNAHTDRMDQLNVIFDVIGTPSLEDIRSTCSPGPARNHLEKLQHKEGKDLRTIYKGAEASALDLLSRMLQFNASKRITVQEALDHPYLRGVRDPSREVEAEIKMDELDLGVGSIGHLKELIYHEVMHYSK